MVDFQITELSTEKVILELWLLYPDRRDEFSRLLVLLTIFGYFCRSGAIDGVKSLWSSSLECSGMLVVKAFPGRFFGVAAISKRSLKHQKLSSF